MAQEVTSEFSLKGGGLGGGGVWNPKVQKFVYQKQPNQYSFCKISFFFDYEIRVRGGGGLWDTDACARPVPSGTKQKCKAKVEEKSSSVTCHGRLSLQYRRWHMECYCSLHVKSPPPPSPPPPRRR